MRKLVALCIALSCSTLVNAQCENLPIPFTAVQVNTSGTTGIDAADVWVCGALDVTIVGSLLNVYIESGSYVQLIGQFNTVFVKDGSTLNVQGDSSIVQFFPTATVNTNGTPSVLAFPCSPMSFDYSNAPAPLCAGINNGVVQVDHGARLELGPNPTDGLLRVRTEQGIIRSVSVVDLTGRESIPVDVMSNGCMDVSPLMSGEYLLRVRTDKGMTTGRFSRR